MAKARVGERKEGKERREERGEEKVGNKGAR